MNKNIVEEIQVLAKQDGRYRPQAYIFLFEALEYTVKKVLGEPRHVNGRELMEGVRRLAIEQFGPLTKLVFRSWGIQTTLDFGHIVFGLVDKGLMGKTESDSLADFEGVYEFDQVFSLNETVQLKLE